MKVLSVESSSVVAGAAIVSDGVLIYEGYSHHKRNHSCVLMPMIETALDAAELKLSDIDVLAVTNGPGSFTGLRIGIATVKGLGIASNKPVAAIPTLDALACNMPGSHGFAEGKSLSAYIPEIAESSDQIIFGAIKLNKDAYSSINNVGSPVIICPILDARRNQVYASIYYSDEGGLFRISEYMALPLTELAIRLKSIGLHVIFLGDGAPVHREALIELMDGKAGFAPPHLMYQRPAVSALLGEIWHSRGFSIDSARLEPFYLRKSQAEQGLEKKK